MESYQYIALSILVIAIILWATEIIDLAITSLLILVLAEVVLRPNLLAHGIQLEKTQFFKPFSSDIIFLFMGGLLLSLALSKSNVDLYLSNFIIKKTAHSAHRMLFMFMILSFITGMWMSNTAATAMMLALTVPVTQLFKENSPFRKSFLISVPFATTLGSITTPIATPPNAIAMKLLKEHGVHISFVEWMLYMLPMAIVGFIFVYWLIRIMFIQNDESIDANQIQTFKLNQKALTVLAILSLTVAMWLTEPMHKINPGIVSIISAVLLFTFKILQGKDLNKISWDVLILIGGGMLLADILDVSKMSQVILTLFSDSSTMFILNISLIIIAAILTSFMSNTATANLIIPMIMILIPQHNLGTILATTIVTSTTLFLPVSSPATALLFSQGGINTKDMLKVGIVFSIFCLFMSFIYLVVN